MYKCTTCSKSYHKKASLAQHLRNGCQQVQDASLSSILLRRQDSKRQRLDFQSTQPEASGSNLTSIDEDTEMGSVADQLPGASHTDAENSIPSITTSTTDTTYDSGRPRRTIRLPRRYQDFTDELPPPPPPIVPELDSFANPPSQPSDTSYTTPLNEFGIFSTYSHGPPSLTPESSHSLATVSDSPNITGSISSTASGWWKCFGSSLENTKTAYFTPFLNASAYRLMRWYYGASTVKSLMELDNLVQHVLLAEDFHLEDLTMFRAARENRRLDEWEDTADFPLAADDGWKTTLVEIPVPAEGFVYTQESAIPKYSVPGLYYRQPLDVIKAALSEPGAQDFHITPHHTYWQPSPDDPKERIYSEIYNSDAFLEEHEHVAAHARANGCTLETVVVALMLYSDSTHLTSFGDTSLWPIYLLLGNLSKYPRGKPSTFSAHHLAYIPKLGDSFSDFYLETYGKRASKAVLTNCRRNLVHAIWELLLDKDFVEAWKLGFPFMFWDGIIRQVFPRIFIYGMDYPEKVLMTLIRYFGNFPCPRCLIPKSEIRWLGLLHDIQLRISKMRIDSQERQSKVKQAWKLVYLKGKGTGSKAVKSLLGSQSLVPIQNAFSQRLSDTGFDFHKMIAPDLLHEFELGVWKRIYLHLIRILAVRGHELVEILNQRFRQVPTFGNGTIQNFRHDMSSAKKLAGRDYEDLLQCALPVFEGLLPSPHNERICKLLFELATWHSLAKLRLHTDSTLTALKGSIRRLGRLLRDFSDHTCPTFETRELAAEAEVRVRRETAANTTSMADTSSLGRKRVLFQLNTYKLHALGDYPRYIQQFGTTDNYSTQTGEVEHKRVKKFYPRAQKGRYTAGIAKQQRREHLLHVLATSDPYNATKSTSPSSKTTQNHSSEHLPPLSPHEHHQISEDSSNPISIYSWLAEHKDDPASKNFVTNLRHHLFMQLMGYMSDRDEDDITTAEANTIIIRNDKIYKHQRLRINYTTYDVRRAQDSINVTTHSDIMLLSPEFAQEGLKFHPYWYARVIGIYHVQVYFRGCKSIPNIHPGQRTMSFLHVRWFGIGVDHNYGWIHKHLPMVGFADVDNDPFGFVNPKHVLRACHIIPAFKFGQTSTILPPSLARQPSDNNQDWLCYYINIFVDRDMMMRYRGGGVGHKSTRNATNQFLTDRDPFDSDFGWGTPLEEDDIVVPTSSSTDLDDNSDVNSDYESEDEREFWRDMAKRVSNQGGLNESEPIDVDDSEVNDIDGQLCDEDILGYGQL